MSINFFNWFWNRKKILAFSTVGALFLFTFFIQFAQKAKQSEPRVYVEVTQPLSKEMIDMVSATGNISAEKETTLSSKIPGKIKTILVKEGDAVSSKQILIQLEAKELHIQKSIAEFAHRSQASAIDEENYKRHRKLFEEGVITKSEFDKIESEYNSAHAEKERLERTVALQEEEVASTEIKAPFDSLTAKIFVHEGEVIAPGTPLAKLVNMDSVTVDIPISAKHINRIQKGMEARIFVESGSELFQGVVDNMSPVADPLSRTFDVKVKLENKSHLLKPGMFAKASIIVDRRPQAITLPKTTLVKKEELKGSEPRSHWIYIIQNKRAHLKEIQVGLENSHDIEVLTSLDPSQGVVTAGQNELYENAPVSIINPPSSSPQP